MISWQWIRNIRYLGWAVSIAALITQYKLGLYWGVWITLMSYGFSFGKIEQISQALTPDNKLPPNNNEKA